MLFKILDAPVRESAWGQTKAIGLKRLANSCIRVRAGIVHRRRGSQLVTSGRTAPTNRRCAASVGQDPVAASGQRSAMKRALRNSERTIGPPCGLIPANLQ